MKAMTTKAEGSEQNPKATTATANATRVRGEGGVEKGGRNGAGRRGANGEYGGGRLNIHSQLG